MNKFFKTTDVENWFESVSVFNKEIKKIYLLGNAAWLTKVFFATMYINDGHEDECWRRSIKRSELDEDTLMTRCISIEGTIVFELEDGVCLGIQPVDYSVFNIGLVSRNEVKEYQNNNECNINVEKLFCTFLGRKIIKVITDNFKKAKWEKEYIKQDYATDCSVRIIRLILDNGHQIYISQNTFCSMDSENEPDAITAKEYLSCIINVEQYFDDENE